MYYRRSIADSFKEDPNFKQKWPGAEFIKVNYSSIPDLVSALKDIETVICTFTVFTDDAVEAERNLITAAVESGCSRFCPSEFAGKLNTIPSYYRKAQIIEVLERTPELEYTAFSPGFFMDYFAVPRAITHLAQFVAYVDAEAGEAIVGGTGDEPIVLTSAKDTARFVVGACALPKGRWPKFGGIVGERTSLNKIISLVESLKGWSYSLRSADAARKEIPGASPHVERDRRRQL